MAGEHLILTDEAAEQQQEDMFARLAQIAKPVSDDGGRKRRKAVKPSGSILRRNSDRPSSFFFKPSESFDAIVERNKKKVKPKKLKHADDEITRRTRKMRRELPPVMLENIDKVRELFLQEIAPKTFAAQTGTLQARTVAQRLLKSDVDPKEFVQFERMVEVGVQIQMAKFVTKYMGLPAREWRNILEVLTPKQSQREIMFMNQSPLQPQQAPEKPQPSKNPTVPSQLKIRRRTPNG